MEHRPEEAYEARNGKVRGRGAFSLVDMLVAVSIMMALVAVVAAIYQIPMQQTKVEVLKTNLRVLRRAIAQFYNDHGRYPYNGQDQYGNIVGFLDDSTSELVNGVYVGLGVRPARPVRYLQSIPYDPTLTEPAPMWLLVPCDNDGDWNPATDDINPPDGLPSWGEPHVNEDPFGGGDDDGDGKIDEDPPDVMDVKSLNPLYRDF